MTSSRTLLPTSRREPRGGSCLSTLGGTQALCSTVRSFARNPLADSADLASAIDSWATSGTVAVLVRGGVVGVVATLGVGPTLVAGGEVGGEVGVGPAGVASEQAARSSTQRRTTTRMPG